MQYKRKVLTNGLKVLAIPMPSFESATVLVMVGAGSRYEQKNNNGISHFLEHMAFKGTTKRPSALEISSTIDGIGGESNAFTGKETTGYYIKSQVTHLDLTMDMLSDMLKNLLLDPQEIDRERGVIIEELNMYEDSPARKVGEVYEQLLYGDTPMGWDIGGRKDVINSVKREDFIDYMNTFYSADNMTVVVAGGITAEKVFAMAEKYFGDMKKFQTKAYPKVSEKQKKPAVLLKTKKTEQVHFALGVRTIGVDSPKRYPLSILAAILGGGMSSRLFHEVRERRGLGYYVRTSSDTYQDVGTLVTSAGVDPKRVDQAIEVVVQEYKKLAQLKEQITAEELKKAKEYLKGHLVLELEDSRSVAGFFASQELTERKTETPEEVLQNIDAVRLSDVEEVASTYLVKETLNLAVIGNFEDRQRFEKLLEL